ncbi:MAG: alpha/beta hydrolase, partial [Pseudomonadota bacterium]
MIRKILLILGILVLLAIAAVTISYMSWSSQAFEALSTDSKITETELGSIEYIVKGKSGPVVLFLHGTPGGYDQGFPESSEVISITPSRPGYLRTPLDVGQTPAEQAKAYVTLLDKLQIGSVVVVGASGGGPSAISFAAMYPERTIALIAIEAVSKSSDIPD